MTLIMMSGSKSATIADLQAVPVPAPTRRHRAMPYGDIVGHVKELIRSHLRAPIVREQYALNKEGQQMFGEFGVDIGEKSLLAFGFRSSYNRTVAAAVAAGMHVMVCDNLQLHGDAMRFSRKNTTNGWADFDALSSQHVRASLGHYRQMQLSDERMRDRSLDSRKGFAILGIAQGEGILTPTQASTAIGDWKGVLNGTPRHEELAEENLWGLYQCVTEGLKKGAPVQRLDRQTKAHSFFEGWL